jgi:hypothetical protein
VVQGRARATSPSHGPVSLVPTVGKHCFIFQSQKGHRNEYLCSRDWVAGESGPCSCIKRDLLLMACCLAA